MSVWISLLLCLGNIVTSLAGMAALKHAVVTSNVVWVLAGVSCWVWTAMFIVLLLHNQPIIWIALISSCLSVAGSVALGSLVFGEPLTPQITLSLALILFALVLTASAG